MVFLRHKGKSEGRGEEGGGRKESERMRERQGTLRTTEKRKGTHRDRK